jgi:hypothetical protein
MDINTEVSVLHPASKFFLSTSMKIKSEYINSLDFHASYQQNTLRFRRKVN